MRFIKMHGIGNDYVYVNGFVHSVDDPAALAVRISDRHTGIGGDGLILVLPPEKGVDAQVRMRMFNADGSEAQMCGNGVRCVCKMAHDHEIVPGIRRINPMRVQTGRGVLSLAYKLDPTGAVDQVTVDMGEPILAPREIPVELADVPQIVDFSTQAIIRLPRTPGSSDWIQASGLDQRMTCVSMGNPHAIFFCKDPSQVPLETVGPMIERHPIFPQRVNVHFVSVANTGEVTLRTWERGSGITQACGTGAAAVCVAGVLCGRTNRRILAHLPGGDLELEWKPSDNHVYMTGPAVEVFTGEWPARPA